MQSAMRGRQRAKGRQTWMWLVKVPGVRRPASGVVPVYFANLRTARCPVGRALTATTSAGFSMATIARAATSSFSHVHFRFSIGVPDAIKIVSMRTTLRVSSVEYVHFANAHALCEYFIAKNVECALELCSHYLMVMVMWIGLFV